MYKLVKNNEGQVCAINMQKGDICYSIPLNPDNTDYQAYLRWLEEGNTPEPAEENQ